MTEILLTRHGDVPWLEPRRFRGRAELKLTDKGIAQAEATARRIGASWQPRAIYASPLGRTLQHRPDHRRAAAPAGAADGRPDRHRLRRSGRASRSDEAQGALAGRGRLWHRRPDLVRPPGGESLQEVLARIARGAAPDDRPAPAGDGACWSGTTASIACSCCMRSSCRSRATGRSARTRARSTGSRRRPRVFVVHTMNDTAHLREG